MPTKITTIGAVPVETTGADVANAGPVTPAAYDQNIANLRAAVDRRALAVGSVAQAFAASGITFPATQVASANPNTLDDYEKGEFTPYAYGVTTAGAGTYVSQVGKYIKIGSEVHFTLMLGWSAHTGAGVLRLGGLPFACSTGVNVPTSVFYDTLTVGVGKQLCPVIVGFTTAVYIRACDPAGGAFSDVAMDTNVLYLWLQGSYPV